MSSRRYGEAFRRILAERFVLVVALLAFFVLLGGVATYVTYASQSEEPDISTEIDHRATVEEENSLYQTGAVLENETTYFTSVSPELDGEFTATHEGGTTDEVHVETEITLRVQWVPWEDEQPNQDELWATTQQLEKETKTLGSGETASSDFTVDVAEERDRIQTYRDEHGEVPGHPKLVVVAETDVVDPDEGNSTIASDREQLSINLVEDIYTVEEQSSDGLAALFPPGMVRTGQLLASIGLLLGSVVTLVGLVVARYRGTIAPDGDRAARSDFEYERNEFDDWISRGRVPDDRLTEPGVEVASLTDLVDVAIDSDRRVVEDPERRSYYVLVDATHYRYDPPGAGDASNPTDSTRSGAPDESAEEATADRN